MKTAKFLRKIDFKTGADQALYELNPPIRETSDPNDAITHVVVSAVDSALMFETLIFKSDASGQVLSWSELSGSMKGTICHAEPLANMGYEITTK